MADCEDSVAKKYAELKEDERIREEGRNSGYNVFRANDETVRICLENEKRKGKTTRDVVIVYKNLRDGDHIVFHRIGDHNKVYDSEYETMDRERRMKKR